MDTSEIREVIRINETTITEHAQQKPLANYTTEELTVELSTRAGVIKKWASADNSIVIETDTPMNVYIVYD